MKRILIVWLILFPSIAFASVYLDATPGQDCSSGTYRETERDCNGTGTGNESYDTLDEFVTNLTAQGINYIRAGNYYTDRSSWSAGSLQIDSNGGASGNPTIITTIAGEERQAVIGTGSGLFQYNPDTDATAVCPTNGTSSNNSNCYYPHPAISVSVNYVTIKNVKTYGMVYTTGSNIIYQDFDFGGGGPCCSSWGHTIYSINVHDVTFTNGYVHDNPHSHEANTHKAIIQSYQSYDIIYEYLTIDNMAEWGVACGDARYVGNQGSITLRNSFINGATAGNGWAGIAQYGEVNYFYIYNNIFLDNLVAITPKQAPNLAEHFYNNTFINNTYDFSDGDADFAFLGQNNLHYHDTGSPRYYNNAFTTPSNMDIDYNVFYYTGTAPSFRASGINTTSLSTWQGSAGIDEDNSLSHDPQFSNITSCKGGDPTGCKRDAYTENFAGSAYGVHAGAYETGSEQIGYSWAADVTAPTVSSASVNAATATINFDEAVVTTGYDAGDFDMDCTSAGQNLSLTSPSGSGAIWTFTVSVSVPNGDTCNLDYTGSTDDIEDLAGNDLATFSNTSVTVNTAAGANTISSGSTNSLSSGSTLSWGTP